MRSSRYSNYRPSIEIWLGAIPHHWREMRAKWLFAQRRERAHPDDPQLAATQAYGVVPQADFMERQGQKVTLALSGTDNFRRVYADDFVISLRSFEGGIEHSAYTGCVTPAYTVIKSVGTIDVAFYRWLLKSRGFVSALNATTEGIRDGKTVPYSSFGEINLPVPPLEEQRRIAAFLDHETRRIDELVQEQGRLVQLLKEERRARSYHLVTRGVVSERSLGPTELSWTQQMPLGWRVVRLKHLFRRVQRPVRDGDQIITCFRDGVVTLRKNRRTEGFTVALQESGYQGVRRGDLVIHAMDAFAGAVGVSDSDGKASPVYSVCVPESDIVHVPYVALVLRSIALTGYIESLSKGIRERSTDLRWSEAGNISIPLPPRNEQEQIVDAASRLALASAELVQEVEQSSRLLRERRSALITAAVTGHIDVREWRPSNAPAPAVEEVASP